MYIVSLRFLLEQWHLNGEEGERKRGTGGRGVGKKWEVGGDQERRDGEGRVDREWERIEVKERVVGERPRGKGERGGMRKVKGEGEGRKDERGEK